MDTIDNLKKIGKNWRLTALVIWLLVGVAIIPFPKTNPIVSIIGILIFLPFLVFLMFLFLLSLISKKNIFEYSPWKIILFLLISLPIMLLLSIILVVLFAISIITYFFFTSWFIFYGCYLIGKRVDEKLVSGEKKHSFLRFIIFFGGLVVSLLLLFLFIIGPTIFDFSIILETPIVFPWYLNGVYLLVGGVLIGLTIVCIVYMFKKSFNGWFGIFAILVAFYTLFLVLKIYMGIVGTGTDPKELATIWAYLGVIIPDLFIIFYSLSTLMGSQAELLSKRIKRFGMDTIIIWLILSKVTYEFIHYFPYEIFNAINIPWFLWINELAILNDELINIVKNIAVLGFFILILIIIGIYEIQKYHKERKKPLQEGLDEKKEVTSPETSTYEPQPILEEESIEELDSADFNEENGINIEKSDDNI
ncbi:MAG: hypothetical protein KGD65_06225 [Candidatus Lokiarchaeota archaeon]|nr:hypothetical protein [Candidatus Lokiarchaeota archaeon]